MLWWETVPLSEGKKVFLESSRDACLKKGEEILPGAQGEAKFGSMIYKNECYDSNTYHVSENLDVRL